MALKYNKRIIPILHIEVGKFTNLTELDLAGNKLSIFPKEVERLSQLTFLNLNENELSTLPLELWTFRQLTNLTTLYLRKNKLVLSQGLDVG